jgi:hypothetical protein
MLDLQGLQGSWLRVLCLRFVRARGRGFLQISADKSPSSGA